MKKSTLVLWIILLVVLGFYIYSSAQKKVSLPRPETSLGEASSYNMPSEVKTGTTQVRNAPAAKGSKELKVTGPVTVLEEKNKGKK